MSERVARGTPDPLGNADAGKMYPTDPRGELDAGLPARIHPCAKRTWCVLSLDHHGSCVEVLRYPINPADFGPLRTK